VVLLVLGDAAVALLWSGLVLMVVAVVVGAVRAARAGRAEGGAVDVVVDPGGDQQEA
jgi:hypothetical protein